jgi:murein DD-endopeptidase MepM/ murein hydrolase activator NlpD
LTRQATRLLLGAVVAGLAIAALRLPAPRVGRPGELLDADAARRWFRRDTLAVGETLTELLVERGLAVPDAAAIVDASPLDPRRIPAGLTLEVSGDSAGSPVSQVRFFVGVDRVIVVRRAADGTDWVAEDTRLPWTTDTLVIRGRVTSSLYAAVEEGSTRFLPPNARQELAWSIADIFEYRVDMSRELQDGDRIRVLFERQRLATGATRIGQVLAAGLERGGNEVQAVALPSDNGRSRYYDQEGRSLAASFLRAPVSFRRVSSGFGGRRHPNLGTVRQHQGTDFSAAAGTPVRTIGDGLVIYAGRRGGYGNTVEVRHPNGYVTRYAHLRGFAGGIRSGVRVSIGQTIAYVGSTGLSTGPHLHFEVLVNGRQRDPRRALQATAGPPLSSRDRPTFERLRAAAAFALDQPAGVVRPAGN